MKIPTLLVSIFLLISIVKARAIVPIQVGGANGEIRILVLVDNDAKLHFLNREPPVIKAVNVDEAEVTFVYKSRRNQSIEFLVFDVDEIVETDFDARRKTMFIIHGWNNDKDSLVNTAISKALLQADDWNIFIVDWRDKAHSLYSIALGAVPGVGDIVAKFITLLQKYTGLSTQNIHLSGHSLGAHVCGRVGSKFNGEIDSILAMDPALPFVDQNDINSRLDPSDAQYVEVIHTNGGLLGFLKPIGHSDFYPNGGMNQKGCGLDAFGRCAHSRSYKYFAESITNNNFAAVSCESLEDWNSGVCDNNEVAYMGGNYLNRVYGTFYLDTAGKEPFALG